MKRRQFIQTAAVASAAALIPSFAFAKSSRKIGIQLYTLRDVIFKDVQGTLKQVADFGYQELELFGYNDGKVFGKPVSEFAKMVKDLGMKITSGHYSTGLINPPDRPAIVGSLSNQWEKAVNDAKVLGQEYMLVAYLQKEERKSMDDYKKVCELINKNAEICKNYGIQIGYHNHDFEFEPIDGQVPYDLMLKELDPKSVSMELDLFWTIYANQDPLKLFAAHPGRFEQWHVKDMSKDDRKRNADVGTGTIDFKPIFAKAKESGMKHFYIEHDNFPSSSIESVKADAQNIKSIIS
jgi:sugar phosphate isomerase/epimerase